MKPKPRTPLTAEERLLAALDPDLDRQRRRQAAIRTVHPPQALLASANRQAWARLLVHYYAHRDPALLASGATRYVRETEYRRWQQARLELAAATIGRPSRTPPRRYRLPLLNRYAA